MTSRCAATRGALIAAIAAIEAIEAIGAVSNASSGRPRIIREPSRSIGSRRREGYSPAAWSARSGSARVARRAGHHAAATLATASAAASAGTRTEGIDRVDAKQLAGQRPRRDQSAGDADDASAGRRHRRLAQDQPENLRARRAKRQANAHLARAFGDGARHHGHGPDNREQKRHEREPAAKRGSQPLRRDGSAHQRLDGRDLEHRHGGIERRDRPSHRWRKRPGIDARLAADDEVHRSSPVLPQEIVDARRRVVRQRLMPHVANDADDDVPVAARLAAADGHAPADRVGDAEQLVRGSLIEHRRMRQPGHVRGLEIPTPHDWNARRLKVTGRDELPSGGWARRRGQRLLGGHQARVRAHAAQRQARGGGGALDARQRAGGVRGVVEERRDRVPGREGSRVRRHAQRERAARRKTWIDGKQPRDRERQQRRAGHEHEGQRDLASDQDTPRSPGRPADHTRVAAQGRRRPLQPERGRNRSDPQQHDNREREPRDVAIEAERGRAWQPGRGRRHERARDRHACGDADSSPCQRGPGLVHNHLTRQPPPAGAERLPHGQLGLSRGQPAEHQRDEIRERDQHHHYRGRTRQFQRPHRAVGNPSAQRLEPELSILVRCGEVARQHGGRRVRPPPGLVERHARRKPADRLVAVDIPTGDELKLVIEAGPEIRAREVEAPRHRQLELHTRGEHADDRVGAAAQAECASNHGRIAVKLRLPELMAEHGHRLAVIVGRQEPPVRGRRADHRQQRGLRFHDLHAIGRARGIHEERADAGRQRGRGVEGARPPEVVEIRIADLNRLALRLLPQCDETRRGRIRQGPPDDGVRETEDGDARGGRERDEQQGPGAGQRLHGQATPRGRQIEPEPGRDSRPIARVLARHTPGAPASPFVDLGLRRGVGVSDAPAGRPDGAPALGHMDGDFLDQLGARVGQRAPDFVSPPIERGIPAAHVSDLRGRVILVSARMNRPQPSRWTARARWPAGVRL